ncbi:hypothetical protein BpHYR1_048395 [Brachionus plicatilis]|uniref:Uncharacterized protein n=1 Tax=Brachionus plicatilis TaxID=10195 RepID=A0A3M7SZE9_BRAPC|nr:hypothetical protein BpHYR1_048395 [Brachionus plicatilis]
MNNYASNSKLVMLMFFNTKNIKSITPLDAFGHMSIKFSTFFIKKKGCSQKQCFFYLNCLFDNGVLSESLKSCFIILCSFQNYNQLWGVSGKLSWCFWVFDIIFCFIRNLKMQQESSDN